MVAVGRNVPMVISVVSIPLIARSLTLTEFGRYSLAMAAYFLGSVLLDMGLPNFLARAARSRDSQVVASTRVDFLGLRSITGMALVVLGAPLAISSSTLPVYLGLLAGALSSTGEEWLLIARGRFGAAAASQWLGKLWYFVMLLLFLSIIDEPTFLVPLGALGIGSVVCSCATFVLVARGGDHVGQQVMFVCRGGSWSGVVTLLKLGMYATPSRIFGALHGPSSSLVVSVFVSAATLGTYGGIDRVVRAISGVCESVTIALLPRFAERSIDGQITQRTVARLAFSGLVGGSLCAGLVAATSPLIVWLLLGSEFASSVPMLRVAAMLLPAAVVSSLINVNVHSVERRSWSNLVSAFAGFATLLLGLALCSLTRAADNGVAVVSTVVAAEVVAMSITTVIAYRTRSN